MWYFIKGDLDGRNLRDAAEISVHSHGELSQLQIFVREILQNSLDNRAGTEKVIVHFRLNYLQGEDRERLLEAVEFDAVAPHVTSVRNEQLATKQGTNFPDSEEVIGADYVLKVLAIEDFGTRGLIGPEYERERDFFQDMPHCFMGLCRNVGDSQKSTDVAGGMHGIGKTVLWKNSRLKLIMFHSLLMTAYTRPDDGSEHSTRLFGQMRLPSHYVDVEAFRGEGYFGNRAERLTRSLYDDEADGYAARLGMSPRSGSSYGTSILVVDFDDPDVDDDIEESSDTAKSIKTAAERYFWPAIVDGKLDVSITTGQGDEAVTVEADPESVPDLLPFIKVYRCAAMNQPDDNTTVVFNDIELPKGPGDEPKGKAKLVVSTRVEEADTQHAEGSLINRAALVRGAGMVVGYWHIPRRGLGGKDFHSVVLGGMACPQSAGDGEQGRLEKLLAWAEPVTHDNWTRNGEMLRNWPKSGNTVIKIRNSVNAAISDATMTKVKPEGNVASLLGQMFPIDTGETPEADPRDISIEVTRPPFRINSDGEPVYAFEIRVTVPAKDRFRKELKPDSWRVNCRYGFHGEGRRRRIIDHAESHFTAVSVDSGNWDKLEMPFGPTAEYERSVDNEMRIYDLRGETGPLDPALARATKHDVEISVFRGYQEE